MSFTRNQFFILVFLIVIGPFILYKLSWIITSEKTAGRVWFMGKTLEVQGTSEHSVIRYKAGKDSLFFNTADDLERAKGDIVSVRYQKNNPKDACINDFVGIWLGTLIYAMFPMLVLLLIYFTPDRLDPLIPKKSKIILGTNPVIKIVR